MGGNVRVKKGRENIILPFILYKTDNSYIQSSVYLENGSDLRQEDGEGCGPLHHAAREGHVDVAAKLLELGAQVIGRGWG